MSLLRKETANQVFVLGIKSRKVQCTCVSLCVWHVITQRLRYKGRETERNGEVRDRDSNEYSSGE